METSNTVEYIHLKEPPKSEVLSFWNTMAFFECQVIRITDDRYEIGSRFGIEIEAPRFKRKYYLYAWSDSPVYEALKSSSISVGDYVSCSTELSYFKKGDRMCEAYKIIPNYAYDDRIPENEHYFSLMRIRRGNITENRSNPFLTKNEIIRHLIGAL